ncbi:hypothetical protein MCRY_20080 [Marivita cryptomonadis]|uniref:hypothetical protein n=1 Tax=Marivita cryptomonadis TaxID=505252 RepID=UPI000A1FAAF6|nr:hypothetical protein [Marivita cryptomonadis]OSQ55717.1 hypothetical protein MCRY_20080 [Marivita cryptomonadis]
MNLSVWAYPWDLHDIGTDVALASLTVQGVNTISLATSYHAGRFLQPGNPKRRVWFPQDGTVYYAVDDDRWDGAEIRPLQADIVETEGDYLGELVARRDAGGPKVSCWTVCLHNTRLGMAHPDHVMRTAQGDPHFYALCPSSPAARAYVTGLAAEISHRYRPDRIELESPDFMGFDHGFHHEKDGLGLLPEDRFLLGLCFCDHCMTRARSAGVPAEAARDKVKALLDAAFTRELPQQQFPGFPQQALDAFRDTPDLHAYLVWRTEPVASLISEIRAATHPGTQLLVIDAEGSWWGGVDLGRIAPHCDGVLYCVYTVPSPRIAPLLASVRKVIGPGKTLIAGFQLFYPEVASAADLRDRVTAAKDLADGFNFYNLGLVPAQRLPWIGAACR